MNDRTWPALVDAGPLLSLEQIARTFRGKSGRRLSIGAVRRWALKGVAGERLRVVTIRGGMYASAAELGRWLRAVATAKPSAGFAVTSSPAKRPALFSPRRRRPGRRYPERTEAK